MKRFVFFFSVFCNGVPWNVRFFLVSCLQRCDRKCLLFIVCCVCVFLFFAWKSLSVSLYLSLSLLLSLATSIRLSLSLPLPLPPSLCVSFSLSLDIFLSFSLPLPLSVCVFQAHLKRAGLLGDGEEVPANLWGSPVEASMMGMPSMSAGGGGCLLTTIIV